MSKKVENLTKFPFPLRENQLCYLLIPPDISLKEVDKIHKYLLTLVLPEKSSEV